MRIVGNFVLFLMFSMSSIVYGLTCFKSTAGSEAGLPNSLCFDTLSASTSEKKFFITTQTPYGIRTQTGELISSYIQNDSQVRYTAKLPLYTKMDSICGEAVTAHISFEGVTKSLENMDLSRVKIFGVVGKTKDYCHLQEIEETFEFIRQSLN